MLKHYNLISSSYGSIHKKREKKRISGWDISGIKKKRILLGKFENNILYKIVIHLLFF